jgi:hypothetical protein
MALQNKNENDVIRAGHILLESWDKSKPPQPAEIIKLLPRGAENTYDDKDFIMGIGTCQECGHYGKTIKEPKDTGIWQCRQCYTGLTDGQIRDRFRKLAEIMECNK